MYPSMYCTVENKNIILYMLIFPQRALKVFAACVPSAHRPQSIHHFQSLSLSSKTSANKAEGSKERP